MIADEHDNNFDAFANNADGKADPAGFLGNVGNITETLVGPNYTQPSKQSKDKINMYHIYVHEL